MIQGSQFAGGGRHGTSPRSRHRARADAQAHAGETTHHDLVEIDHPLVCTKAPTLITRQQELLGLVEHLRQVGSFAYDSEFIGELTYVPRLCLIQIATGDRIGLVDPLVGLDLRPFWELVADPGVRKIVHAGAQDVEPVFAAIGRPPANLLDTQMAAGFIGLAYPPSLSKLVFSMLGVKLAKGLTFTHWDRRPLSEHQLRYAADDVRYLPAISQQILERLDGLGHTAWAMEESATLADPALYAFDAETQYLKIRGAGSLLPRNAAVLRALVAWRDAAARQRDVPPRSLLRDEIVLEMARKPVESVAELSRVRGLPRPLEQSDGATLVELTREALALREDALPAQRPLDPGPREKFRADALFAAAQCICAGRQIDPALVTSRQEIGEFFRLMSEGKSVEHLRMMRGWRLEAMGKELVELWRGKEEVSLRWRDGMLVRGEK